jgi:hypothetical protein
MTEKRTTEDYAPLKAIHMPWHGQARVTYRLYDEQP